MIAKELTNLWKSLNFPIVSHQQVLFKTKSVVDLYKKYRKRKSVQIEKELKGLFDIMKVDGSWLCLEDKKTLHHADSNIRSSWVQHPKRSRFESIHPSK